MNGHVNTQATDVGCISVRPMDLQTVNALVYLHCTGIAA